MANVFYVRYVKRMFDLIIGLVLLILLLPLILFAALIVRIDSDGPAFFTQRRLGLNGHVFTLYKLRTMTDKRRVPDREIYCGDPEVTRVGWWLRRLKIDELPQIVNVVAGEMSLVGPRPALPSQLDEYDSESARRLLVRPGLTGLAQVNGNIHLSWEERWHYDVQYVDSASFLADLSILIRTVILLLVGEQKMVKKVLRG